jgi:hypothetical protein
MSKRLYNNREIQEKIANLARDLPETILQRFCNKYHSKEVFDINFPLLLKIHLILPTQKKLKL